MRPGTSASVGRLLDRSLRRLGLTQDTPPDCAAWRAFLDLVAALLADHEQERYLLERSLEHSSQEMLELYENVRASAELLTQEHDQLRSAHSVLNATLESTADGILVVGTDGKITHLNRRFAQMWRIPREILDTRDDAAALAHVVSQLADPQAFVAKVEALYETPEAHSHDVLEFLDGRVFERESLPQRLDGDIIGRVWSFRDITAEARLRTELQHRALYDGLTGLANRLVLDEHLELAIRGLSRSGGYLAVAVVDLDGFKHINDSLGHPIGDAVLITTAERLRTNLREADVVARLGGDEFAVLLTGLTAPEDAARLGERLVSVLADPIDLPDRRVTLGASVGITVVDEITDPARILGQADMAMYRAKHGGKGRYQIFEPSMHALAVERLNLEQALRTAVPHSELRLHYQPLVTADTHQIRAFEALARWQHPTRGLIAPDVFIPLAEETGLIHEIGRCVLTTACRQAKQWQNTYPDSPPTVSVNVSPYQILVDDFASGVGEVLAQTDLPPWALAIEITESALVTSAATVTANLEQLRQIGVRVAIDDFGTGYSSLSILADLPADTLKIDKRFVDRLTHDPRAPGLVRAVVELANTLGMTTVAEGVEDPTQAEALRDLGCQMLQGYLFAKPMPADEVTDFLQSQCE